MLRLVAHRGGPAHRPENTVMAVAHALATGIEGVEIDVHLSADEKLISHHDFRLNPAATRLDGRWIEVAESHLLNSLTYDQLKKYDVGKRRPHPLDGDSAADVQFPDQVSADGQSIPRLGEILDLFEQPENAGAILQIELKRDASRPELSAGRQAYTRAIVEELAESPLLPRLWVISFDWGLLRQIKAQMPALKTGFLSDLDSYRPDRTDAPWADGYHPSRFGGSFPAAIEAAGGQAWGPNFRDLSRERAEDARKRGLELAVWTVNTGEDLRRMIEWDVAMAESDDPWTLSQYLAASAQRP